MKPRQVIIVLSFPTAPGALAGDGMKQPALASPAAGEGGGGPGAACRLWRSAPRAAGCLLGRSVFVYLRAVQSFRTGLQVTSP